MRHFICAVPAPRRTQPTRRHFIFAVPAPRRTQPTRRHFIALSLVVLVSGCSPASKPTSGAAPIPTIAPDPPKPPTTPKPTTPPKPTNPEPLERPSITKTTPAGDDVLSSSDQSTLRAGGLRVESYSSQTYYVLYEADPKLQITPLSAALGARRLGARVEPFTQDASASGSVDRGGEIATIAVAKQLQIMGWLVTLAQPAHMLKTANEQLANKAKTARAQPEGKITPTLAELKVSGSVRFTAVSKGDATVSALQGTVAFAAPDGQALSRREVAVEAKVPATEEPVISKRLEQATRAALKRFVRALASDKELARALVAYVKRLPR
jgi:hypothetical protein